jgi:ankyrin repeat protein
MTAVIHDDTETLLNYLANKNGDVSRIFHPELDFPGYSCSLLHVAAMNNSSSASRILLDFGYDLSSSDSDGNLPIHQCSEQESVDTLNVFLEKDASHLVTDSKVITYGTSVWLDRSRQS